MSKAFGDSITLGVAASSGHSWVALVQSVGLSLTNCGVSGAMAIDGAPSIYATTPSATDKFTIAYGTNDEITYGTSAQKRGYYKAALAAYIAWLGSALTSGQSGITYSGTWTNLSSYGGALFKRSDQNGSTASFSFSGDVLYLTTLQQDIATGTFSIVIDGMNKGSFSTAAPGINSTLGASFGPQLIRIAGLGAGLHNVVLTVTSPSGGANAIYIGPWGTPSPGASVALQNVLRLSNAAYSTYSVTEANVASYCADVSDLCSTYAADGLNVRLVDAFKAVNPCCDLSQSDGVHPVDSGHAKLAAQYIAILTGAINYLPISVVKGSDGNYYVDDNPRIRIATA